MSPEVHNGNSFRRTKEKKEKTKKNLTLFVRFDIILVESEERLRTLLHSNGMTGCQR
jgi:hypothetical protein